MLGSARIRVTKKHFVYLEKMLEIDNPDNNIFLWN